MKEKERKKEAFLRGGKELERKKKVPRKRCATISFGNPELFLP
jgi:hypothetical protein